MTTQAPILRQSEAQQQQVKPTHVALIWWVGRTLVPLTYQNKIDRIYARVWTLDATPTDNMYRKNLLIKHTVESAVQMAPAYMAVNVNWPEHGCTSCQVWMIPTTCWCHTNRWDCVYGSMWINLGIGSRWLLSLPSRGDITDNSNGCALRFYGTRNKTVLQQLHRSSVEGSFPFATTLRRYTCNYEAFAVKVQRAFRLFRKRTFARAVLECCTLSADVSESILFDYCDESSVPHRPVPSHRSRCRLFSWSL